MAKGNIHAAIDYFSQGIRLNPSNTDLIYCLATCYRKLSMHGNTLNWFMHGVALKPKWLEGLMGLAYTYFSLQNWQLSLKYAQFAIENYDKKQKN